MGVTEEQQHIVMLPFMAQGHLIPFLALANQIAQRFPFTITIATTPLNVHYLRSAASNSNPQINFFDLPFNATDHGLPPAIENTEAVPLHLLTNLFRVSTSLQGVFRALIHDLTTRDGAPPVCIISDFFMGWANEVAESSGISPEKCLDWLCYDIKGL